MLLLVGISQQEQRKQKLFKHFTWQHARDFSYCKCTMENTTDDTLGPQGERDACLLANGIDNKKRHIQWCVRHKLEVKITFLIRFLAKPHRSFWIMQIVMMLQLVYMPGKGERLLLELNLKGKSPWREASW